MGDEPRRIASISGKLAKLKSALEQLRKEKADAVLRAEGLEKQLGEALQNHKQLTEEHERLKLAKALVSTGADKAEMKHRVKNMVREIDKCIALLNR